MTNKKQIKKAISLLSLLNERQENKLWKDYDKYYNNTIEPQLKKVNGILASGYYPYYTDTYKWLKKYKFKLVQKSYPNYFIVNNAYKYMRL